MKKDRFHQFFDFIIDNIFDILTVGISIFLIIKNEFDSFEISKVPMLVTWLLAVMGLLAVSGVWDRSRRYKKIENDVSNLFTLYEKKFSKRPLPNEFFLPAKSLPDDLFDTANTIVLIGITLNRTTRRFMQILSHRLQTGCKIRFILIDPESKAVMETMSKRSMGDTTPEFWKSRMELVIQVISVIQNTPNSKGKVEVGYLPYIPSFGFFMVDPSEPNGNTFIEIYHHRTAEENPMFQIYAKDDPYWWSFFSNQAEIMWQDCRKPQNS